MDDAKTVETIIDCLGKQENILTVMNCMTRLRVTVKSDELVNVEELKALDKVMGLVHDRVSSYEIVVGPGNSRKYADICHEKGMPTAVSDENDWKKNKAELKKNQKENKLRNFLKIIGEIFVPLIPGTISAGLCAGFASLISQVVPDYANHAVWNIVYSILSLINQSFMVYITAWAGYRAAERFGSTPILGGMLGMITSLDGINGIAKTVGLFNEEIPLQSILRTGKGGILAVICGVFILSVVEKKIRKIMPASLDIVLTPLVSLVICIVPFIFILMPLFGYVSNAIVWVFGKACMSESTAVRLITGYLASALFLPLVAAGMHHGLVALYAVQLQELGYVTLFPALVMAGAGQVGAAIAIYIKAKKVKHTKMTSVISGALPAGFLGVGEPLIYGVTLPMGRPFVTAGLGAGFGGAFVMLFKVASTSWGPSGLLCTFLMTAGTGSAVKSMVLFLIGLVISYIMSFIITNFLITENDVKNALGGIPEQKEKQNSKNAKASGTENEKAGEKADTLNEKAYKSVRHGEKIQFGESKEVIFRHIIKDSVGIHARPAGLISETAGQFKCSVTIENGSRKASGKSVVELMALGAVKGTEITVHIEGVEAQEAAEKLKTLMNEKL